MASNFAGPAREALSGCSASRGYFPTAAIHAIGDSSACLSIVTLLNTDERLTLPCGIPTKAATSERPISAKVNRSRAPARTTSSEACLSSIQFRFIFDCENWRVLLPGEPDGISFSKIITDAKGEVHGRETSLQTVAALHSSTSLRSHSRRSSFPRNDRHEGGQRPRRAITARATRETGPKAFACPRLYRRSARSSRRVRQEWRPREEACRDRVHQH